MPKKQKSMISVRLSDEQRQVVEDNMPLVSFFLGKYCNLYCRARKQEIEDLKQDLYMGLCRAVYEYKPSIGGFSNYAIWWCRSFLTRWRRMMEPLKRHVQCDGMDFDDGFRPELERWRALLDNLSKKEKRLLAAMRKKGQTKWNIGLNSYRYQLNFTKLVIKLYREHIG